MLPVVGFLGATHLGLIMAAASAAKGCITVLMDDRPYGETVWHLKEKEPGYPIPITGTGTGILRHAEHFDDLVTCDLLFITQDVDKPEDVERVEFLFELAARRRRALFVPVVIMSQVPPGTTRRLVGDPPHDYPSVYYQLDTLRIGHAVERALRPEQFVVGMREVQALPRLYWNYLNSFYDYDSRPHLPIKQVTYEAAELAKSLINAYLAAQVTVTNLGAALAKELGADWAAMKPIFENDRRIGPYAYLEPGAGFAGSHLLRDVKRLASLTADHRIDWTFIEALRQSANGVK